MATQSIICGTCATAVPNGRLSCPACGELLASVAHARRAATSKAPRAVPGVLYEVAPAPADADDDGQLPPQSAPRDIDSELPWMSDPTDGDADATEAADDPSTDDDLSAPDDDDSEGDDDENVPVPAGPTWGLPGMSLTGSPTPSYMPRPGLGPVAPAVAFAGPGAYVPPMPMSVVSAGPAMPAREWAGHAPDPVPAPAAQEPPKAAAEVDPLEAAAERRARFAEFVGWLSVAGAAFSAVGFLLPWGMVMIGSSGVGYFDRWGLAGPAHVVVALGLLAILALAFITNPVPVWIRTGVAGLGLGALLFGLVWPYLIGPLGSGPGALIVGVGAVALAMSGILALMADRHVEVEPAV
jgi:hypothetical protein